MKRLLSFLTVVVIIASLSGCYIIPLVGYPKGNWISEDGYIHIEFLSDSENENELDCSSIEIPDRASIVLHTYIGYDGSLVLDVRYDSPANEEDEESADGYESTIVMTGRYKYYPKQKKITWVISYSEIDYYPVGTEIVLHKIE